MTSKDGYMTSKDGSIPNGELNLSDIKEHLNRPDKKLGEPGKQQVNIGWELGKFFLFAGAGFSFLMLSISYLLGQIFPGSLSSDIILPVLMLCGVGLLAYGTCNFRKFKKKVD